MLSNHVIKNFVEQIKPDDFSFFVMGIDIGGTNTNIGVAGVKNSKIYLLFSLSFKSIELQSIIPAVNETLDFVKQNYNIKIEIACIGAAGVVSKNMDFAELTNVKWNVNTKDLIDQTSLTSAFIINDFQTIGYAINLLDHKNEGDIFTIREGEKSKHKSTKAIIGAGTGLGKSILVYDAHFKGYVPIPSEGGHADFPAQNDFENELVDFIKKLRGLSQPLTYEDLLSGRGIESIYLFLREKNKFNLTIYSDEIDTVYDKSPLISKYRELDETCKETFRLFTRFYGRCAKNFVLDSFATDGIYIAGGIAVKNKDIFSSKEFFEEFENAQRRSNVLKELPVYVVVNYDVSILGACIAAMHKYLGDKI